MERLIRHCPPTRFDYAQHGTIWQYIINKENTQYFVQVSNDEVKPQWERMSSLLEVAFESFFRNDEFIEETVKLYHHYNEKPLEKISKILNP